MARTGRPRLTLTGLVASGDFDATKRRHRELLFHDELSPAEPNYRRLKSVQESYRRKHGVGPDAVAIAKLFANEVSKGLLAESMA